VRLQGLEPWTP